MKKHPFTAKADYRKYFQGFLFYNALFAFMCFVVLFTIPYHNKNLQLFALSDKLDLLRNSHSPRIIFVGGSNLAYGLDSKMIASQFNLPTVNMGLHAGLGLKFILDVITPYVEKNDIVVIVPEYSHFFGGRMYGDIELLFVLAHVYPEGIRYVDLAQGMSLLDKIPFFVFSDARLSLWNCLFFKNNGYGPEKDISSYDRRAFNRDGDLTGRLKGKLDFQPYKKYDGGLNPDIITLMDRFHRKMQDRGVKVYFLFQAVQKATYEAQSDNIDLARENMKHLKLKALNTPEECVFGDNFFFDSPYHLNDKGIELRTRQIINALRTVL